MVPVQIARYGQFRVIVRRFYDGCKTVQPFPPARTLSLTIAPQIFEMQSGEWFPMCACISIPFLTADSRSKVRTWRSSYVSLSGRSYSCSSRTWYVWITSFGIKLNWALIQDRNSYIPDRQRWVLHLFWSWIRREYQQSTGGPCTLHPRRRPIRWCHGLFAWCFSCVNVHCSITSGDARITTP